MTLKCVAFIRWMVLCKLRLSSNIRTTKLYSALLNGVDLKLHCLVIIT